MDKQTNLENAQARIAEASDQAVLADLERELLGRDGLLGQQLKEIPSLPPPERGPAGRAANELKAALTAGLLARAAELAETDLAADREGIGFDATLPAPPVERGSLHPITKVTRKLVQIFSSMGYHILDGPEVELDWYNFEALNIPADHPARDSQDTFYCDEQGRLVLRTHTSPVQVRAMERMAPPFRLVCPGKVFRHENTDATHEHTFHQMEGLVVGKDISVGHLVGTMKTLLRGIFGKEIDVRLRPGHFPFVEPGFELDARCVFCESGCRVCKGTCWIELLPCGLVHPKVLEAAGIDSSEWSGFAFGLGLSRLAMLSHGIDDVRHLLGGDLRFLEQFSC
ncbi:MAG TPA: phenylalanine--tRNA ligase subunit alpha [Planctomycetes bacterium]|nr:phenylalanine--tRNA ligase subunit alpha [Planctomycetota bacterium]HIL36469.1 phenylalanine--tRNA ligase subunit alpha [Planctomycetota bacterium]